MMSVRRVDERLLETHSWECLSATSSKNLLIGRWGWTRCTPGAFHASIPRVVMTRVGLRAGYERSQALKWGAS